MRIEEIYIDVPSYEGLYQVSNLGNVKSLSRFTIQNKYLEEKIMKPNLKKNGYFSLNLYKDGKLRSFAIHSLMGESFLNHTPNRSMVIDHINNDKEDNRLENLQIITSRENISKGIRLKNYTSKYVGVYFNKQNKKWRSRIIFNGVSNYLGSFTNEYDAHLAYQTALKNGSRVK